MTFPFRGGLLLLLLRQKYLVRVLGVLLARPEFFFGADFEQRLAVVRLRRPDIATFLSEVSIANIQEPDRRVKHSLDLFELPAPVAVAGEEPFVHP